MKALKILLLIFICHPAICQDGFLPLNEQKNVSYSDVATLPKSKDEIYQKAQKWVEKTFGNYENAATQQDAQNGTLVINSYVPVSHSLYDYIRLDLTFQCRNNHYQVKIDKLDGTSAIRTPVRFSSKDNDAVTEKEMAFKVEKNRKKRSEAEKLWQHAKADNDRINNAMYRLMANLKEFMVTESGN